MSRCPSSTNAVAIVLMLALAGAGFGASPNPSAHKDTAMNQHASGVFDIKLTPQTVTDPAEAGFHDRLGFDKQFRGDLEASAKGVMLAVRTAVEGSAGYVAIERIEGRLHGRQGSFLLQHSGHMSHAGQHMTITVIPDSGTGELVGLRGQLAITIVDGQHRYGFDYVLPAGP